MLLMEKEKNAVKVFKSDYLNIQGFDHGNHFFWAFLKMS